MVEAPLTLMLAQLSCAAATLVDDLDDLCIRLLLLLLVLPLPLGPCLRRCLSGAVPSAGAAGEACSSSLLLTLPVWMLLTLMLLGLVLPGVLLAGLLAATSFATGMLPLCSPVLLLLLRASAPCPPAAAAAAAQPAGPAWHCQRRRVHMLQGGSRG